MARWNKCREDHLTLPDELRIGAETMLALDIGGSLAKVAYINRGQTNGKKKRSELHLVTFSNRDLDQCLECIRQNALNDHNAHRVTIPATGVGCYKYKEKISQALSVNLQPDANELGHAAQGLAFLWRHLASDELLYPESVMSGLTFRLPLVESGLLPCLLVSMGSAFLTIKVEKDGTATCFKGGSTQGGLTFLGLGSLLTKATSFEELVKLAECGDHRKLDLLVQDVASCEYNTAPPEGMVSSFGKAAHFECQNQTDCNKTFSEEDMASSLLYCITDQMVQMAYMVSRCENVSRLVFFGSFLTNNHSIITQIKTKLGMCCHYFQHEVQPQFIRYEGYLGAIGALVGQFPHLLHNQSPEQCIDDG